MEKIDKVKEEKLKACYNELMQVLDKYNAFMRVQFEAKNVFEQQGIFATIVIESKPDADNQNK